MSSPIRLVQVTNGTTRRVAVVEEPALIPLSYASVYDLITTALEQRGVPIREFIDKARLGTSLDYDAVYNGTSEWKLLPPIDHPEPSRLIISGTGLTHLGSAKNRDSMHAKLTAEEEKTLTDSMKIFRWGVEQGRPAPGQIGIAPEWFYKGNGTLLRAHGQPLDWTCYSQDGGEEAEIVGIYIITPCGNPLRIGMAQGNEFSDHVFERKNYLNLAGSKLRTSSVGPEIVLHPDFASVPGEVSVLRDGKTLWSKTLTTGEKEMCHSLANMEHHHFKFEPHRRPGDIHIHFFGTSALSYGDGIRLQNGDVMQVSFQGFGRPLRNPVKVAAEPDKLVEIRKLK